MTVLPYACRAQSERFGTRIYSETVTKVDLSRRPFKVWTDEKAVEAETVIIATGGQPNIIGPETSACKCMT